MTGVGVFLFQAALALFGFFVVAPCVLNAVSVFGVQKRFAQQMVEQGVVKTEEVKNMQPKKEIAGVIVSLAVIFALCYSSYRSAPMGYFCGGISVAAGLWKYRNILELNSLTVRRFRNTYKDCINNEKYNKYVATHF